MFSPSFKKVWGSGHSAARILIPMTVQLIQRWELELKYWYPDGKRADGTTKWSCCYGHAEDGDHPPFKRTEGQTFTSEECNVILALDINTKAKWIDRKVKVPITPYMFGALTSLVYQYGQGNLDKSGLVIPALNDGRYVDAACEILQLNKKSNGQVSKGHTLRRASECALFMVRKD